MAADKPHGDAFLAAIEAKIAAWTAVRDTYRAAVSIDGPLSDAGGIVSAAGRSNALAHAVAHGHALPVGIFRDKSLKEAIPIYLGTGRRKQTNKEIAIGLQAGGFPTTADNFEATVATALYRLKKDGVLLRFPDGWDLAASYPDSLRNRLEKDAKPRRSNSATTTKAATKRRKASAKAKAEVIRKPRTRRTAADGPSIDQQILKILTIDGLSSPAALAARLGQPVNVVGLALGRLAKLEKVERLANGHYTAAKQEPALRAV